ncbi:MAG: sulfurtransferase complex subunit TusB [Gammaproteobacteria bacterium]
MLHLINYAFSGPCEAHRVLARLGENDCALFLGNAVFSVVNGSVLAEAIRSNERTIRIYALSPDLAVRGIAVNELLPDVETVDYPGFVRLAAETGPVQSWFR